MGEKESMAVGREAASGMATGRVRAPLGNLDPSPASRADDDGDDLSGDERRQHGPGPMRPSSSLRESPSRASSGRVADGSAGDGSTGSSETNDPNDPDDDGDSPLDDERRQHGPGPIRPSSLRESPSRASGGSTSLRESPSNASSGRVADGSAGDGSTGSLETNDPNDDGVRLQTPRSNATATRSADAYAEADSATRDITDSPETTWESTSNAPRDRPSGLAAGRSGDQGQSDASAGGGSAGADIDADDLSGDEARMPGNPKFGN